MARADDAKTTPTPKDTAGSTDRPARALASAHGESCGPALGVVARLEAIQAAAWAAWSAALLVTGATAYFIFTLLKELDPSLPGYAQYQGPHWRLLGGYVAERLFLGADVVGFLAVCLGGGTFALGCWKGRPQPRTWTAASRAVLILAMIGLTTYRFAMLQPQMQQAVTAYRVAAIQGQTEAAQTHQRAYDALHRKASNALVASLGLSLGALVLTLATTGRVLAGGLDAASATAQARTPSLPEPALVARRRR
ncbi:MAG: hypothetical protein KatS3mg103_0091 [Phycisphaerales bacterium]|nr:MAG: hypothetical protein KatS3mg103_0091 [Phycisphaerales bacterium]